MPVFISHRTADDAIAASVAGRLRQHGIVVYVDDFDKATATAKSDRALTSVIVARLNACTNLLAIVTANTNGSWWVPFEIGVARQAPRAITSMTNLEMRQLPEYLREWPILRGDVAVDTYAAMYKAQRQLLTESVMEKRASAADPFATVSAFQQQLKARLGQY